MKVLLNEVEKKIQYKKQWNWFRFVQIWQMKLHVWFHKIDHKAVNQLHCMTINYILFGKQVHLRKWSFNKTDGNMASKKRRSN